MRRYRFMPTENKQKKPFWKKWWFWTLMIAALIGGVIEYVEPETEENTIAIIEEPETKVAEEPEPETKIAEEPETEPESKIAEEPETEKKDTTEMKDISAYELLTLEGHPVLYDYLSAAHTFWDDYADERIDFGDDVFYDFETGKTVLTIETYLALEHALDEHMIRGFNIYPDIEISLDEGLSLAKSYIPIDIMKKWYALKTSECYRFVESNSYDYMLFYVPTESGKENIDQQKLDYNYVEVILHVENDVVKTIDISSTYTSYRNRGEYELQDWNYDFLEQL